jgi:gluconolactonase
MKPKVLFAIACSLLATGLTFGQGGGAGGQGAGGGPGGGGAQQAPPTDTVAPDIPGVVKGGTVVKFLKGGFNGAQGATALKDGSLLFTERLSNKITKIDKDDNFSTYMEGTDLSNSFAFDPKGRVIAVQWMPPRIGTLAPTKTTIADKVDGHEIGRPNDLVIDKKGDIYFTDDLGVPAKGIKPGVYCINPKGQIFTVTNDMARPNGIEVSPNEKVLYVDDTNGVNIRAFDIQPDGSTKNERVFAAITEGVRKTPDGGTNSGADGAAIDAAGRLYVSGNTGVQVFDAKGQYLGNIPVSRGVNNLGFAGPDKKTLYIMGGNALFKVALLTPGFKGRLK